MKTLAGLSIVLLLVLSAACARTAPRALDSAIDAVACGTADGPGSVPRAHTVYADGRVVRWNGRSGTGGVLLGTARAGAVDSLWEAARALAAETNDPAMGPLAFIDVTEGGEVRRHARGAGATTGTLFGAAFTACTRAVGSVH